MTYRTIQWVEDLAFQEKLIVEGKRASIDTVATRDAVLNLETASFLRALYHQLSDSTRLFNLRVGEMAIGLALSKQDERLESFSIERNGVRFSLSRSSPGVIQFTCLRNSDGRSDVGFSGVVEAAFIAFHEIEWRFLGNPADPELLARHWLTEFLEASRLPVAVPWLQR